MTVRILFVVALVLALMPVSPALAQTNWTGANSNDFADPGNWDNGLPDNSTDTYIDSGPTAVLNTPLAETFGLNIGSMGGQTGVLSVTAGGQLTVYGQSYIGDNVGDGSLWIDALGFVDVFDTLTLGNSGGTGAIDIMNGGQLTLGTFNVGIGGTGTINLSAGGQLISGGTSLGNGFGFGTATMNIDGALTNWTDSGVVGVGGFGATGYINITNGGSMSAAALSVRIGDVTVSDAGSSITISGDNSVLSSGGNIYLNDGGALNIGAGALSAAAASGTVAASGVSGLGFTNGTLVFNHTDNAYDFDAEMSGTLDVDVYAGTTTFTSTTSNINGDLSVHGGTLVLTTGFQSVATHIYSGATLGGEATLISNVTNEGDLSPGHGVAPGTYVDFVITGDYTGVAGSRLLLNADLTDNTSPVDTLTIDGGAATGSTEIVINNVGVLGADTTGDGIRIISAINGATIAANTFTMAAPVASGMFNYSLFQGDEAGLTPYDYFLRTDSVRAAVGGQGASVGLAAAYINGMMSMMSAHSQDMGQDIDVVSRLKLGFNGGLGDMPLAAGVWVRAFGGQAKVENDDALDSEYDGSFQGMQAGKDLWRNTHADGSKTRAGLYLAQGFAQADLSTNAGNAGEADMSATSLGAYVTHYKNNGVYVSGAAQYNRVHGLKVSQNTGEAIDTPGNGASVSLEAGKSIKAGKRLIVEPSAQAVYQMLKFKDANDGVADVSFKTLSTATGRAGARVKYMHETTDGMIVQPWGQVNVFHTLDTDSELTFDGTDTFVSPVGGTRGEVQVGLTFGRNDGADSAGWNAYASAGYQHGLSGAELSAWTVGAGLRFNW